jgi:hypothetical protein
MGICLKAINKKGLTAIAYEKASQARDKQEGGWKADLFKIF